MILSITAAAKKVGIGRSTLYAMRKKGTISFTQKKDGTLGVDLSELERAFPAKTSISFSTKTHKDNSGNDHRLAITEREITHLEEKVRFLENQLALEQDRVATLLEINKNNSEKLLLTHQEQKYPSLWKKIVGNV